MSSASQVLRSEAWRLRGLLPALLGAPELQQRKPMCRARSRPCLATAAVGTLQCTVEGSASSVCRSILLIVQTLLCLRPRRT